MGRAPIGDAGEGSGHISLRSPVRNHLATPLARFARGVEEKVS